MAKKYRTKNAAARAAREDARARLLATARAAGVVAFPDAMALGERWVRDDDGRTYRYRAPRSALPTAAEATAALRATVRAEGRVDVEVPARDLRICPETGRLFRMGDPAGRTGGRRPYLPRVLAQIAGLLIYAPRHMGSYLLDRPAPKRAAELADIVAEDANADVDVVLRLRTPAPTAAGVGDLGQHVYAAVSKSFRPYDPDALCDDLDELLAAESPSSPWGPETSARVYYRGTSTTFELVSEAPSGGGEVAARISTADDTSGAVQVHAGIALWSGVYLGKSRHVARVIHFGKDDERFRNGIRAGLAEAAGLAETFAEDWADREATALGATEGEFAAAVRWLCGDVYATDDAGKRVQTHRGWLRLAGVAPEALAAAVLDAHATLNAIRPEGEAPVGYSVAGLAHAIAHAAYTAGFQEERANELLEAASALFWARPAAVLVWTGRRDRGDAKVSDRNLELDAELRRLIGAAAEWEEIAAEAAAAGDEATAAEARERSEYLQVIRDAKEEKGRV